jgi:hypothetical protein
LDQELARIALDQAEGLSIEAAPGMSQDRSAQPASLHDTRVPSLVFPARLFY